MSIVYGKENLTGFIYKAFHFRCYECGNDEFVHEGTTGGDGFNCWWNGFCSKCKVHYEMDETTVVTKTLRQFA